MKNTVALLLLLCTFGMKAQEINTKQGFAAEGYDVVAYFDGKALEGDKEMVTSYQGVNYAFASQKNLKTFQANPSKFIPEYGGYCAYAIATTGKKVGINPKAFQIKDGKLYLFYKTVFADTLEKWNEDDPDVLQEKADMNWEKIAMKKN
ncbi:MAG: YHS domain-containing (seleno)protein [Marinirhabdus sp.]|nr:YHS domain-containing (seleno)protein [Marinirhabdus sp.]